MNHTGYIVDTSILSSLPPAHHWHASQSLSDPTKSLLAIEWDTGSDVAAFEAQAGVVSLGERWETLPAETAALLASFYDAPLSVKGAATVGLPNLDAPVAVETVGGALKKLSWPGGRLIR